MLHRKASESPNFACNCHFIVFWTKERKLIDFPRVNFAH